jgi:outer membrane protein OmpA-like peptidoglycan-associated protein
LDELAGFLKSTSNVKVEIGGHTNSVPPDDYCDKLSTARAKAVAEYLIANGVEQSKVQFKGYGKRNPIMSNKTQNGRMRNQRVEIKILNVE